MIPTSTPGRDAALCRAWRRSALSSERRVSEVGGSCVALRLPSRWSGSGAERGDLVQQVAHAPDTARALRRLERSVDRLTWGLVATGLLGAGVLLRASEGPGGLNTGLLIAAAVAFVWGLTRR